MIIRYIRTDSTQPWTADNTFAAINTGNTIEWDENNFRFLKLVEPISEGYSWPGNTYIDATSFSSDAPYLYGWTYSYDSLNVPMIINGTVVDSTIKVNEADQIDTSSNINTFTQSIYSAENYAKGIGLVYRNFLYEQYQPPTYDTVNNVPVQETAPYYTGYGVILTMVSHN